MREDNENLNNIGVPADREKKDRRMENLIDIVEKHTRTKRHLEQYSDIGEPEHKEEAREKQELREKQIDELKEQIISEKNKTIPKEDQLDSVKENYRYGEGYLKSNADHMSDGDLENLKKRQTNRKQQIENLEDRE